MPDLSFFTDSLLEDVQHKNKTSLFYDPGEEELFKKNKHLVDPIYLERDVEYRFNSLGYRTGELTSVEDDNFMLVFGCSHTEGVGLFEEDIWCSQLSKMTGLDKINLGKGSSGPDIQYLNTLQYIKNGYPKPKLVIYQWPQTTRRSFAYIPGLSDPLAELVIKHQTVNSKAERADTKWYFRRFCSEPGELMLTCYSSYSACELLWRAQGVPVFNWTWAGDFNENVLVEGLEVVSPVDTGRARDLIHDGADIHRQVAEWMLPKIDKLL